ncbi:hypothetical protein [Streptomyces sp. cg36]|uniref:hypothetical protein n=1 Tax=Streptomyces sp. cg36 TaxID=3238798 RepID=UPI0034E245BA
MGSGRAAAVTDLFTRGPVTTFLQLARTGELRARTVADPARRSDHSEQTRLEVLRLLVTACGAEDYADLPPQINPQSKPVVATRPRTLFRSQLTTLADQAGAPRGRVRMLAMGAVVCDTGLRAGELCARTVEDLAPTLEELRVVRRPQGWSESEAYTELLPLSGLSRAALRRWLPERHDLLTAVGGTATALWVSLKPNHHGGRAVPAGTPLEPRGLAREWTRAVDDTNGQLAGEPSWEPLPRRMEQLRRGVTPKGTAAPMQADAERAAVLLDAVAARARALAALHREGETDSTAGLQARIEVRQAVREAWAEGIEHAVQLSVLAEAGLPDTASLAAAGWEPVLLAAIERDRGWGRPSKAATAQASHT